MRWCMGEAQKGSLVDGVFLGLSRSVHDIPNTFVAS